MSGKSEFDLWFPPAQCSHDNPRIRVFAFHGAGMTPQIYTHPGPPSAPMSIRLLEFCREEEIDLHAVMLPGRLQRTNEPIRSSATIPSIAQKVCDLISPMLEDSGVPYVFVGHSMGCWIIFELLKDIIKRSLPLPQHVFLSAMVSPDIEDKDRPWKNSRGLPTEEFKEECRQWGASDAVFTPSAWPTFEPLLRGDFRLFDEYTFTPPASTSGSGPAFPGVNVTLLRPQNDHRVTPERMKGWEKFFSESKFVELPDADHNFVLKANHAREKFFEEVISVLDGMILDLEYV